MTPLRVEKRLNVSGRGRQPSSTRVSAIPWRRGANPVSIYAPLPGLTFGAKAWTGGIQELTRKDMEGGFEEGRMGGVGGKVRYKYRLGRPSFTHFFLTFFFPFISHNYLFFPALVPVRLTFFFKNSGAGKRTIKVDSFSKSPKDKTNYTRTGMTYFPF